MKTISNQREYEAIMTRINELAEIVDDSTSKNDVNYIELDFLTDLVVAYEKANFPIGKTDLSEILTSYMQENGINQKKMAELLEVSTPRISEYITGKSQPTLSVAKKIHKRLNINADLILA